MDDPFPDGQLTARRYRPFPESAQCTGPGVGPDVRAYLYDATTGAPVAPPAADACDPATGPKLGSWTDMKAHLGGRPYTVDGGDGTPWRVIVSDIDLVNRVTG